MFINDKVGIALLGALIGLLPQIYKFLKDHRVEKESLSVGMIAQLQQEGQAIRRELRVEIDSLKSEVRELKLQNESQEKEIDMIKNENSGLKLENNRLRFRVSDLEDQVKEYKNNQGQG